MALHSLPNHEPLYIDRIPVDIHLAALRYGWRFLPAWSGKQLAAKHGHFFEATANLLQLRCWARERPKGWILVTGRVSGVFALEVDGVEGLTSLLRICRDDWSWLDTRRAVAGETRYIFFVFPMEDGKSAAVRKSARAPGYIEVKATWSSSRHLERHKVRSLPT